MAESFIASDDVPAWSGSSTFHEGNCEYELKWGKHEQVSMMQAMVGQRGPTLEARSGSCLIIAVYVPRHEAGLLIHLWRDEDLSAEAADLMSRPFNRYPQLGDSPIVWLLTSQELGAAYPRQMDQAKQLILNFAPKAQFHELEATDKDGEIGVTIELDTATATLTVYDDFGSNSVINCK